MYIALDLIASLWRSRWSLELKNVVLETNLQALAELGRRGGREFFLF
jgi:hypothetical protein